MSTLIRQQHLRDYATAALPRMARAQKHWQHAFGIKTRGDVSRKFSGERPSEATKVLITLDTLARSAGTTPWPLLAEGYVVVTQAQMREKSTAELEARLAELNDREHDLEAKENRAVASSKSRLERATARIVESEAQLEAAAIERELWEREQRA